MSSPIRLPVFKRPATRADCEALPRPCPFSRTCHYGLEANDWRMESKNNQGIQHLRGQLQRAEGGVTESCSLDVADRGPHELEVIGRYLGVSREAVRLVEARALKKLAKNFRMRKLQNA